MFIDLNGNGKNDFDEVVDGIKEFIKDERDLLNKHVASSTDWLKGEIAGLSKEAQAFASAAMDQAASRSASLETTVTNTLNILFHDSIAKAAGLEEQAIAELKALSSKAIASAIGLTHADKAL